MNKFKVTLRETYEIEVEVEAMDAGAAREESALSYSGDAERRMAEALVNDKARLVDQRVVTCVPSVEPRKFYDVDPTRKLMRGKLPKAQKATKAGEQA